MCLSAMGDYDKGLEVINTSICQYGQLPDLLIMRARINYMFGNVRSIGCPDYVCKYFIIYS